MMVSQFVAPKRLVVQIQNMGVQNIKCGDSAVMLSQFAAPERPGVQLQNVGVHNIKCGSATGVLLSSLFSC